MKTYLNFFENSVEWYQASFNNLLKFVKYFLKHGFFLEAIAMISL